MLVILFTCCTIQFHVFCPRCTHNSFQPISKIVSAYSAKFDFTSRYTCCKFHECSVSLHEIWDNWKVLEFSKCWYWWKIIINQTYPLATQIKSRFHDSFATRHEKILLLFSQKSFKIIRIFVSCKMKLNFFLETCYHNLPLVRYIVKTHSKVECHCHHPQIILWKIKKNIFLNSFPQ